jgi:hypothetical protein
VFSGRKEVNKKKLEENVNALRQGFRQEIQCFPVRIIPPAVNNNLHLQSYFIHKGKKKKPRGFRPEVELNRKSGSIKTKK